jgi:predicted GIY-YIG superfamily endonuclease
MLTNRRNGTLYTGVTSDLPRRLWQHRTGYYRGFTNRYGLDRLVYRETFETAAAAIAREKQIKAGSRRKKLAPIELQNPEWDDLAPGFDT